MQKIIFLTLSFIILAIILSLGVSAIIKGFKAKNKKDSKKSSDN